MVNLLMRDFKTLIVMPTYNEVASAPAIINSVLTEAPHIDLLIVDDGSLDGTVEAIRDSLSTSFLERVSFLERTQKTGLGAAYLAGFDWGYQRNYELLIEMDADGSHQSSDLIKLLSAFHHNQNVDLVLGSRWIPNGAVVDWPKHREYLSRTANMYAGLILKSSVKDMTSGFRIYRASSLRKIDFRDIQSQGYCFQIEMTRKILDINGKVLEVPITFVERKYGSSKMNWKIVLEAMVRVTLWGLTKK
jgi:dolichol-phosphate mannosyltransferase